jgi:hypothetical protein
LRRRKTTTPFPFFENISRHGHSLLPNHPQIDNFNIVPTGNRPQIAKIP